MYLKQVVVVNYVGLYGEITEADSGCVVYPYGD